MTMNKLKISILAAACAIPFSSFAQYQMYDDGVNKVGLSGWVDVRAVNTQGNTELVDGASRFRLSLSRQLTPELQAFAVTEVGVNVVGTTEISIAGGDTVHTRNDETFNMRLGYIGLAHDSYGSISLGKQWGVYMDVAENTDLPHGWASTAAGAYTFNGDGGLNGTGRADKAIQYRNSFGNFSFAIQMQARISSDEFFDVVEANDPITVNGQPTDLQHISYDHTHGMSVRYKFTDKLNVVMAHNQGEFVATMANNDTLSAKDTITGIALTYGKLYDDGLYLGMNANQSENHEVDNVGRIIPKSVGFELVSGYSLGNGFTPMFSVNYLKADDSYNELYQDSEFTRAFAVVGVHYDFSKETILYAEARKDYSDMSKAQLKHEDDGIAVGIRMYF